MKKENIIGFSAVALVVLGLFLFRNGSVSKTYRTDEVELTREQAVKEMPLLEISEEDQLLRDAVLELDMVQEAMASAEDIVLLDPEKMMMHLGEYFPEGFLLNEGFTMGETVGLDFSSEKLRLIYEFGQEHFYKTMGVLDGDGRGEPVYTNKDNETFTKLKTRLDQIEFSLQQ